MTRYILDFIALVSLVATAVGLVVVAAAVIGP